MSGTALHRAGPELDAFRHEAFLYAGAEGFLRGTLPFIRAGLDAAEPVLVVVGAAKIDHLREELGADAAGVSFADMAEVGRNPARIIPAWREFLSARGGAGPARGIGEPVVAERTAEELLECQRHEALLNVAFAGGEPWRLLCPYDTAALDQEVIEAVRHSHPFLREGAAPVESAHYRGDTWEGPSGERLPDPPGDALPLAFGPGSLEGVRRFVIDHVADTLHAMKLSDLLLAITEVAGNSIVHGGGTGTVRSWSTSTSVVCEIADRGWIRQPLVGRARPELDREDGRGLWMVNQLCDLVQIRSSPAGTVVRLHMLREAQLQHPS